MSAPLRVLIVEDSEDDTLLVVRELERGGYTPTFERVETAEAMTDVLKKRAWDIIISDYSMPHFSAPEALKLLQETGLDLPFIIVSGSIGEETAVAVMKAGAYAERDKSTMPAVILLDLKLPKIDGLEVLQRIRADERTKLLPVVILTSSKEEQDIINGYKLGANGYVRKPVDFNQFSDAVRQLGLYWLLLNEPPPR